MFVCVVSDKRIIHGYHIGDTAFGQYLFFYWLLSIIRLLKLEKMKPIIECAISLYRTIGTINQKMNLITHEAVRQRSLRKRQKHYE